MIKSLTSLRFVFMMLIFFSHYTYEPFPAFDFGGECGVAFFFMLSGFVLSLRYGREIEDRTFRHKKFVIHQLSKFYPLHILCTLLVMAIGFKYIDGNYLLHLIPSILLLQSWIPDESYYYFGNAVSWYLSTILFHYLVFPYVYRMMHKGAKILTLTALVALPVYAVYLSLIPESTFNGTVYAQPIVRTYDFAFGILACRMMPTVREWLKGTATRSLAEVAAVAVVVLAWWVYPDIDNRIHCACLFWPVHFFVLLVFGSEQTSKGIISSVLHTRIMQFFGSITFEFFLIHVIIIHILHLICIKTGVFVAEEMLMPLCLTATVACSWMVNQHITNYERKRSKTN